MDKEKEQRTVDSKFELLKFPKEEEDISNYPPTMYEISVVFSTGKNLEMVCAGFAPMEHIGKDMIGFYSGDSTSVHTIVNCKKIDFMDIEEVEI